MSRSSSSSGSSVSGLAGWTDRRAGSTSGSSGGRLVVSLSSSDSDSTDTSAASSSSTFDSSSEPEVSDDEREFRNQEARLGSLALRHVRPEHVSDALDHYATKVPADLMAKGKPSEDESGTAMSDEEHGEMFKRIAQQNPKTPGSRRSARR